jgi:hypothetical protein
MRRCGYSTRTPPASSRELGADDRTRRHLDSLHVAAFYSSLHLNLADNLRRLGSFDAAGEHVDKVRRHCDALPDDDYGTQIRQFVDAVAGAIEDERTERLPTAPACG